MESKEKFDAAMEIAKKKKKKLGSSCCAVHATTKE
jgi:hypothetical protein